MAISPNSNICEETTFASVFKSQAKQLRNFLFYKFKNLELAEDITQEAFLKLWQNCKEVPLEKVKSYLYTIANNTTLNALAHEKVVLTYANNHNSEDKTNQNPEYLLEEEQFKEKLLHAISKLNETQRIAFLMHRVDGKKYAEIAVILDISVKAVEKRIHLALVELRKEIENFK